MLKVQDLALGVPAASYPFGAGPNPPTGLPHIGGNGSWALGWLREHPDLRYRLHPALTPSDAGRPIRTLRLWHESATAPDPLPAFQIWVSDDNATYRPYQGPLRLKPSSRRRRPPVFAPAPETRLGPEETFFCLEFAGLELREPFFCIVPEAPVDFANTLAALVEVEDSAGDSVAVTFGFTAVQPYGQAGHDWRRAGISFDTSRRTQLPGRGKKYSAGRDRFTLAERLTGSPNKQTAPAGCPEAEWVVLGMARGRNLYLTGLVDFAYETVHHCLHTMLERALDAGVDAVDIRSGSHTETLDWENYGFSPVAVAEFQRRYGVDVATQVFDRRAWQTLMGEYYDRFITEAAARVRRRGAKFYAHIMPTMDGLPEWPEGVAWHNQAWNWRNWLTEGLLDGATFKGCRVDSQMFGEFGSGSNKREQI